MAEAFGDGLLACQTTGTSDLLSQHVPVYTFLFAYPKADFILPEVIDLKAFHSAEIQFVYQRPMGWFEYDFKGKELALSHKMSDYWTQFAATGNPNGKVDLHWPEYKANEQRIVFDLEISTQRHYKHEICKFWNSMDYRKEPLPEF